VTVDVEWTSERRRDDQANHGGPQHGRRHLNVGMTANHDSPEPEGQRNRERNERTDY
jgi:hypothetical protein